MKSDAATVDDYLRELPADRRAAIEAVRKVIRKNLDKDYEEGMQYGTLSYYVPHSVYPAGYHCDPRQPLMFAAIASQKNYLSFYFMPIYGDANLRTWFEQAWADAGKKLDAGKACIRFKRVEDLALDVIGQAVRRVPARAYIAACEAARQAQSQGPRKKAVKKALTRRRAKE